MAQFEPALERLLRLEGGYVNDPDDPGGETFAGISRRHHSRWSGWRRIDALRDAPDFPDGLEQDPALRLHVRAFYEERFWSFLHGEELSSQALAEFLFQMAVNMGLRRTVRTAQRCANLLNVDGGRFPELATDGIFGPRTLSALERLTEAGQESFLMELLAAKQRERYIRLAERNPALRRFLKGWFWRVEEALTSRPDRRSELAGRGVAPSPDRAS